MQIKDNRDILNLYLLFGKKNHESSFWLSEITVPLAFLYICV